MKFHRPSYIESYYFAPSYPPEIDGIVIVEGNTYLSSRMWRNQICTNMEASSLLDNFSYSGMFYESHLIKKNYQSSLALNPKIYNSNWPDKICLLVA